MAGQSQPAPNDELPMKVIGKRKSSSGLLAAAPLLELALRLHGNKPFIPKGVHRFATFEESDQWTLMMLTRRRKRDPRS
jgi:hypothetical protein